MRLIFACIFVYVLIAGMFLLPVEAPLPASLVQNGLVINEFMALNDSTVTDTAGQYDDWIELYNCSDAPLDISGYYLSDKLDNPLKWRIDTTYTMLAHEYIIIWADENGSQGPFHANFKLAAAGESIYLRDSSGVLLDSVNFGVQTSDMSSARIPNGTGDFVITEATFDATNDWPTSTRPLIRPDQFLLYPNPATDQLRVQVDASELNSELRVLNSVGQQVYQKRIQMADSYIDLSEWPSGLYFFQYKGLTQKIRKEK